ncbi:MAG: CPBP family glutamic-type intramembrane protease [Spirochaetia bacterium]|nr:CPBP family glutamic-type intramembrane protease [Spirochaetia bacterium]
MKVKPLENNGEQIIKKNIWAALVYFLLPKNVQNAADDFLTSDELKKLSLSKKKIKNFEHAYDNILPLFISRLQKPALKAKLPEYFFTVCFLAGLFSLLTVDNLEISAKNFILPVNFFVYACAGYFLLKRKKAEYWRLRFISVPFEFSFFAFSAFSLALIVFLVGWLSLDAYPARINIFLFFQAVIAGPLIEEIFFRDYVYSLFQSKKTSNFIYDDLPAVFISSAAFAAAHISPVNWHFEAAAYLTAGALLGFLRWMSKSLLYPFAVHAAANGVLLWM